MLILNPLYTAQGLSIQSVLNKCLPSIWMLYNVTLNCTEQLHVL